MERRVRITIDVSTGLVHDEDVEDVVRDAMIREFGTVCADRLVVKVHS